MSAGNARMSDKSGPPPGRPIDNAPRWSAVTGNVSACPRDVRRALAWLRRHYAENVVLADVAAAAGTSERTLRRNFHRFLGVTVLAYLRQLRLTAVRDELLRGRGDNQPRRGSPWFQSFRSVFYCLPGMFWRNAIRHLSEEPGGSLFLITRRDQGTTNERSLVVIASADTFGREMNLFADNLGEQFAASLGGASFLSVRLMTAKADRLALNQSTASTFASYVFTARVIQEVDVIRVVTRLMATDDGRHLWAETFDGTLDNVLAFQARIVAVVPEATRSAVVTAEIQAAQDTPSGALRDRDLVLRALPLALSPDRFGHAFETLYRAMELCPDNGLAVALAAWCHAQSVTPWNEHAGRDRTRALALAERAGVLDPTDPLVLTARAAVMTMAQDFDTAETLVQRALAIDPRCSWAWERRGWLKALTKHSETAIADFEQALRLAGPESDGASSLFGIGTAHWCHREYGASMDWVDRAAARRPNAPGILAQLAGCHIRLGNPTRGRAILETLMRVRPEITAGHISEAVWFDKPCPSVANVLSQGGMTP